MSLDWHTDGGQQSGDWRVVGLTSRLILPQNTSTDAFNDTDLGGLFVIQLAQTEGEGSELLHNLRQSLPRARTLKNIGRSGTTVQGSTVVQGLDLAGTQTETNLNTPDFTDVGHTFTLDSGARREDNLLISFNLIALEQPAGCVLDHIAVVGLGDLLDQVGDLSLSGRLLSCSLLLFFLGSASQKARRNHESQEELIGVVRCEDEVGQTAGHNILGANDDLITHDRSKAIDLRTKLDLSQLTGLEGSLGLLGVRHQRGVGRHVRAGGDGGRVSDTFLRGTEVLTTNRSGKEN